MNQKIFIGTFAIVFAALILSMSTLFTVDQRETAFVLQFGELKSVYDTPGLKIKAPFIQEVIKYDKRLQNVNLPAMEYTAGDQKRIVIDVFSRYLITNPVLFYKTVQDIKGANVRLETIISRSMRRVIGEIALTKLLSEERVQIMDTIHKEVKHAAADFGIDLKDVRIVRADFPKENSLAIFDRMQSERDREAKFHLAEGDKAAKEIRSKAERERTVILAEANQKARLIEGDGDAQSTRIYAEATSQDPDFFEFYRSLEAYQEAIGQDTTFVLSKENKFFKHF